MKPNVLWLTLESTRFDYTSFGRNDRTLTPNLMDIAVRSDGRAFDNCFSHARWTPEASASILTGTYPSTHQVGHSENEGRTKLPDELNTAPELLKQQGYRTAGFSENGYMSHVTGLDRGFESFQFGISTKSLASNAGFETLARYFTVGREFSSKYSSNPRHHKSSLKGLLQVYNSLEWMKAQEDHDEPFFGYVHMNSSHHPYLPPLAALERVLENDDLQPEEAIEIASSVTNNKWDVMADGCDLSSKQRRALLATYTAEISYLDYLVGIFFDYVKTLDDTIVVITGEHGMIGHTLSLHDHILNVPLVTYGLDLSGTEEDGIVQHMDVMETLLDQVGADTEQFQGYNLSEEERRFAIAERGPRDDDLKKITDRNPNADLDQIPRGEATAIRSPDWKYVTSSDGAKLFRLPDEDTDVSEVNPEKTSELQQSLEELLPSVTLTDSVDEAEIDKDMREHLRQMGYLE